MRRNKSALACAVALFALNVWIAHRLFALDFTALQSNETAFISIARFFHDYLFHNHVPDAGWFPWFDAGMPVEHAYQPLLPALTALLSVLTHVSVPRAFHIVLALAYCLGPVTLFWFVWDWSKSASLAFLSGLLYSLISPAAMLFPQLRSGPGVFGPLRLYNLVYFGEDPHILALTLLPVALLYLRRAVVRRDGRSFAAAVIFCAAVALTNAFGVPILALGALCVVLAANTGLRGAAIALSAGVAAWCLSAPLLPPSLIETMRSNAWSARGQYDGTPRAYLAAAGVILIFGILWRITIRFSPFDRFVCLFAVWTCAFPVVFYSTGVTLVPQSHRYQLELEMGLCLLLGWLLLKLIRAGHIARIAVTLALAVVVIHQVHAWRNTAHTLIKPFDIQNSAEYKVARWIDRNLPGMRTMVSGDAAWVFNVFSDNPQLSAGHEPTALNFIQQIAVYQIYSGMNAGAKDAEVSLLWLKAFGNQAVTVPGLNTREAYKPFTNPGKFEGVLPVLWRGDGDTIYDIPQRSRTLAHVIPAEAAVNRRPVNGLDLDPLRAYVSALDDPALPVAEMKPEGQSKALIRATMKPGQLLSVQRNYDPAWRARVQGRERPVKTDGLGLILIDSGCAGDCEIELSRAVTSEMWICRFLSVLAAVLVVIMCIFRHHELELSNG